MQTPLPSPFRAHWVHHLDADCVVVVSTWWLSAKVQRALARNKDLVLKTKSPKGQVQNQHVKGVGLVTKRRDLERKMQRKDAMQQR